MIEKIVLDYLNSKLDAPCYMEDPMMDTFVLIEKTGSSKVDHVNGATFAIQSYAPSLYEAAALNEAVKEAMEDIVSLPEIGGVYLNSDYNFTDTTTKRYRYQAVYLLYYV